MPSRLYALVVVKAVTRDEQVQELDAGEGKSERRPDYSPGSICPINYTRLARLGQVPSPSSNACPNCSFPARSVDTLSSALMPSEYLGSARHA
jgi:hypothetical protein